MMARKIMNMLHRHLNTESPFASKGERASTFRGTTLVPPESLRPAGGTLAQ